VLRAPAKVNLGLRVLGRRPDGYHLIESLFAPLALSDEVHLAFAPADAPDVRISVESATAGRGALAGDVPADARNLAARAAEAFLEAAGLGGRVEIGLVKHVPAAAGLGGGSSDAAAVLRGLSTLTGEPLPEPTLARLALGLGADVPFFLAPCPALVGGVGERIEPVDGLPRLVLLLANPGLSLATADVYAAWDALESALTPAPAGSTMRAFSDFLACDPSDAAARAHRLEALLRNDLEAAAVRLCPPIGRLRRRLREAGAVATGMSGSGATVYGVFADEANAAEARDILVTGRASGEARWAHVSATGPVTAAATTRSRAARESGATADAGREVGGQDG